MTTTEPQPRGSSPPRRRRQRSLRFRGFLLALACLSGGASAAFSARNHRRTTRLLMSTTERDPKTAAAKSDPDPTATGSSGGGGGSNIPPGSPLAMILLEQQEFELEVGHAMDVLREDYPLILHTKPDFSIYDQDLELIDPAGVQLHGLNNYKAAFRLLHGVVGIFYSPDQSLLKSRMCFDKARQNIRISWNAEVIPKAIFGGQRSTLHVDGISVYEISRVSGNITQHRIERLIINDTPIVPEQGIFAALRGYYNKKTDMDGIPVYNTGLESNEVARFRSFSPASSSTLFKAVSPDSDVGGSLSDDLEQKNAARKKFGLDPLSMDEYVELQEQVQIMESQQRQRSAAAAAEIAANKKKEEERGSGGFFRKMLGGSLLKDTCESNYDCQRPEVCCDFGFKKTCCSSGMRIVDGRSRYGQLAEVPVLADPGPNGYPRDDDDPRQRRRY